MKPSKKNQSQANQILHFNYFSMPEAISVSLNKEKWIFEARLNEVAVKESFERLFGKLWTNAELAQKYDVIFNKLQKKVAEYNAKLAKNKVYENSITQAEADSSNNARSIARNLWNTQINTAFEWPDRDRLLTALDLHSLKDAHAQAPVGPALIPASPAIDTGTPAPQPRVAQNSVKPEPTTLTERILRARRQLLWWGEL